MTLHELDIGKDLFFRFLSLFAVPSVGGAARYASTIYIKKDYFAPIAGWVNLRSSMK